MNYKKLSLAIALGICAGEPMILCIELGVDMVVEVLL